MFVILLGSVEKKSQRKERIDDLKKAVMMI